ncbi:MAG: hypothetical protein ACR2IA_13500 [Pyrinomonadaceae bacterium]
MKDTNLNAVKMLLSVAVFVCFALAFSINIAAQKTEMPAREFINITVVSVKPEMVPDFEQMIKTEYNPAFTKGGGTNSEVWQTVFGDGFEYYFAQPISKFAQLDGPSPLEKGLGADGAKSFFAKASKMVTGVRSFVIQTRPDMSYMPELNAPPKVAVAVYLRVNPGKNAEFENYMMNDQLPVIKKSGIPGFWVSKVVFGGNGNEYIALVLQKDFADLDNGPPISRVLKPEEAMKLNQKMSAGVMENMELNVMRFNSDLSIMPAPTAPTAKK